MRRGLVSWAALLCAGIIAGRAAAVPPTISYQGRLTDGGAPVPDNTYEIVFRIYAADAGGSPLWLETQEVATADGLFTVLLGSVAPIGEGVFDGSVRYLTMQQEGAAESAPRIPIVSVPYAMTAGSVEGAAADCSDCDTIFLNAIGPDELRAAVDTALKVTDTGAAARVGLRARLETSTTDTVSAIRGIAYNGGSGRTQAASFDATGEGGGPVHGINVQATGNGSSYTTMGVTAQATNDAAGTARGGYFAATNDGFGDHVGAIGQSYSPNTSAAKSIGLWGNARHYGIGRCVGGMFAAADGANTFGVDASATSANADSTCAVRGYAKNSATGGTSDAIGGVFIADSAGTAWKWGSIGLAYGGSREATGVYGWAETNATVSRATGVFGQASNTGPGDTQGGYFWGHGESGDTYGAKTFGYSTTGSVSGLYAHGSVTDNVYPVYGVYGRVDNYSSGSFNSEAYAGYFENCVYNASNAYGLYGHVYDVQGIYACYGVVGRTAHTGSGSSIAGSFETDSTGTGTAYGVRASGLSKGSAPAYGVYGSVASRGNGNLYAGYFKVSDYGTGLRYGVYASSSVSGYAGYFSGDVRVTGDQVVVGSKSAAVEVEPEDYRLVYSQESPECWFEDFGEGQLVNGRTHVELDPVFLRTVTVSAQHPMKVFIQLNDPDCNGTAVVRGMTGFDVIELQNGQGSASFTYRVVAKRKGYEDVRLAQMPGQTPEEVEAEAKQAEARLQTEEEQAAQREIAERDRLAQIRQEERERQEARPFGDRD